MPDPELVYQRAGLGVPGEAGGRSTPDQVAAWAGRSDTCAHDAKFEIGGPMSELVDQVRVRRSLEARIAERDRLIRTLRERVTDRKLFALWLEKEIAARDRTIGELHDCIRANEADLERTRAELAAMRSSRAWRVAARLRRVAGLARGWRTKAETFPTRIVRGIVGASLRVRSSMDRGHQPGAQIVGRPEFVAEGSATANEAALSQSELSPSTVRDRNSILDYIPQRGSPYELWLHNNSPDRSDANRLLRRLRTRPSFSILLMGPGKDPRHYQESLASLREQIYPNYEILVVHQADARAAFMPGANDLIADRGEGIVALMQRIESVSGDYLVVLEEGARLSPEALLEFAIAIEGRAEPPDLIFADEDRIDPDGRRFGPRFRSGWSPEMMLSQNAVGRTFAVRRAAYESIGGLRPAFGHAWQYDLALRLSEVSDRIAQIQKVLVSVAVEAADEGDLEACSPKLVEESGRALAEAIGRRGIAADVTIPGWAARRRLAVFQLDFPARGPRVAIIIPTRDRVDLLRRCIDSILARTDYDRYEIIVIDNGSEEPDTLSFLDRLRPPCRVVRIASEGNEFNYARIHNRAIAELSDEIEFVVLLNNDTEVRRPEWLSQLVGYGSIPGVGAVGARLLYADGRVQHAGMATDLFDEAPGHAFRFAPWWTPGDQCLSRVTRNVNAVTAACMLIRRRVYLEVGGLDEVRFAVGYNDVDLVMRLGARGLRCVYAARAELLHLEGASRGIEDNPLELDSFIESWGGRPDPHRHPARAPHDERFGISTRRLGPVERGADHSIRVLVVLPRLDGDGTSRFARNLVRGLQPGTNLIAEVWCGRDGPIGQSLRDDGIRVTVDPRLRSDSSLDPSDLADAFGRGGVDLVLAAGIESFAAVHASRLASVPSLWTVRETMDFRDAFVTLRDNAAQAAIEAFSDAYRVIFPAWSVRRAYHPVESARNFEVVREGIAIPSAIPDRIMARSRSGLPREAAIITCVHDSVDESIFDVLDATRDLLKIGRDVVVQILGPSGLNYLLSEDGRSAQLGSRLRLLPPTGEIADALASSDLLVNCAHRDLSPEAIALGKSFRLPMALSRVDGIDEFVQDGRSALLFEPGDVRGLGRAVDAILVGSGCRRIGMASSRCPSVAAMAATYERLIREAVAVGSIRTSPPVARLPDAA